MFEVFLSNSLINIVIIINIMTSLNIEVHGNNLTHFIFTNVKCTNEECLNNNLLNPFTILLEFQYIFI